MTLAWHFAGVDASGAPVCRYDGRPIRAGETLAERRPLVLCEVGLHASERIIDAIRYAPGSVICRVRLGGKILRGPDKLCASERTVIAMLDSATGARVLRAFARRCALDVVHLWDCPPVVRRYLETGDESIRAAARAAALDAALDAAWDAARDAQDKRLTEMVEAAMAVEVAP